MAEIEVPLGHDVHDDDADAALQVGKAFGGERQSGFGTVLVPRADELDHRDDPHIIHLIANIGRVHVGNGAGMVKVATGGAPISTATPPPGPLPTGSSPSVSSRCPHSMTSASTWLPR